MRLKSFVLITAKYRRACASQARSAVQKDRDLAESLGVSGTPTIYVCRKSGDVVMIKNPADLSRIVL